MYKDIISYRLADGVTEDHLMTVAKAVFESWMSRQTGLLHWEIHRNSDGGYTDIVYWRGEADAKGAQADMVNIPNAGDWFACYEEGSISSQNLHQVGAFVNS